MSQTKQKDLLLQKIRDGQHLNGREQLRLAATLSIPSMLAQLSAILMEYIDAAMVGSLGANASASIGIVSTTIWLFAGLCSAFSKGFYVQVAHRIGANEWAEARNILRQGLSSCLQFSALLAVIGVGISPYLPVWLGGDESIRHDASIYFMVFCLCIPLMQMNSLCSGMLRCSGDTRSPSLPLPHSAGHHHPRCRAGCAGSRAGHRHLLCFRSADDAILCLHPIA